MPARRMSVTIAMLAVLAAGAATSAAAQALFESQRLTPPREYPKGIEGPAVDAAGNLYVVNFKKQGQIGRLRPGATQSELFATLPSDGVKPSIGNGIRFDRDGRMYVADYNRHKIFVFERGETEPRPYFESGLFHQPNDLAIAADGTLYASDPKRSANTGQIWRITRGPNGKGHGEIMSTEPKRKMGVTNGIDLSPDGTTLYVSESKTREIWAYRIQGAKLIVPPHPLKTFDGPAGSELDGMRTDVDGNIFVARPGAGAISVLTSTGNPVREIPLKGKDPTNLTFGGPDGKTVFVTQSAGGPEDNGGGFVEFFRVERPGREPCMQVGGAFC